MDRTRNNEPDDPLRARELTERSRTKPTHSQGVREWTELTLRCTGIDRTQNPVTSMAHGNPNAHYDRQCAGEWTERARTKPRRSGMDRTQLNERDDHQDAREWTESTRTNPTTPRAHGSGTRTNRMTTRAHRYGTNAHQPTCRGNGMNAPNDTKAERE